MKHKKIRDWLGAYLDNELSPHDQAEVETHLNECQECRSELAQLRMLDTLSRQLPHPPQKDEYWEALPAKIHSDIADQIKAAPLKERKMFKNIFEGTIVDGNSGQDGLEYVALAAIILVVLVIVGRLIAQKLQEGGEAATGW